MQTNFTKTFRNRSIATKTNIALGFAALSAILGVVIIGKIAENEIWSQAQTQAKSELKVLSKDFESSSIPVKSGAFSAFGPANFTEKSALTVNKNLIIITKTGNAKGSIGGKFDPNGLIGSSINSGNQITSTELVDGNLEVFTVTPTKDQNQKISGANILIKSQIKAPDPKEIVGGNNKSKTGTIEFAGLSKDLKTDLADSGLSASLPENFVKKAQIETAIAEAKIGERSFIFVAAPVFNLSGQPVATFLLVNKYEPSLIFYQIFAVGLVFIIVGFVLAQRIMAVIIKSILATKTSVQRYLDGNLSTQIQLNSSDEVGEIAGLVNTMMTKMNRSEIERSRVSTQIQSQTIEIENEVGQLLDVVSDLESGDLRVQAQVTDLATGLVADTLNRLIEQLVTTVSTVLSTAQQVTQGADSLEQLATSVTQNTQLQSQSVAEATLGIENINNLATNAATEATKANVAVESAQVAVSLGQTEITKLNNSIILLQQGTLQIIERLKTLKEFVDLAKQFGQDQKRLSSLTQVVAMNASMIAARAVEQKEPDQFASVAREFEVIATQVNNLATQTSQGLVVLQQRTGFIEIVVSGISQDINDVTANVKEFTTGVEQSSRVFNEIKYATTQVASLGQTVFESSKEIALAVKNSVDSIQEIAALAQRSASQSNLTLERSAQIGKLARRLLSDVSFFQLPAHKIPQNFLVSPVNANFLDE